MAFLSPANAGVTVHNIAVARAAADWYEYQSQFLTRPSARRAYLRAAAILRSEIARLS